MEKNQRERAGARPRPQARDDEHILCGRNAITEALVSDRAIHALYIRRGELSGALRVLAAKAKEKGIIIKTVDGKKLDEMCGAATHQGVVALVAQKAYSSVEDIFNCARQRKEQPFILICDGIEDPHNLGAIIRTAECAGAHGVIIPKRRNAGLTFATAKASAGAVEHMHVARVTNLAETLEEIKKRGVWVYAADMAGENWCSMDFQGAIAIVIGSEGQGISRLIKDRSDYIVSLPMKGKLNSLNASVAAGILCYEAARQKSGLAARNF